MLWGSVCCRGEPDGKPQAPLDENEASTKPEPEAEIETEPKPVEIAKSGPTVKPKPKLSTPMWLIAVLLAVAVQAWSEIGWRKELLRESPAPRMVVLPALWMVLTN